MTAFDQRRRDPQPMGQGWEAPVAVIGGVTLGATFAALAGLGVASLVWGGGWVWPDGKGSIRHTVGGLLAGHPGRGLPEPQRLLVAGPGAVYTCVVSAEVLLVALVIAGAALVVRYRRPSDARRGMATRYETEHVVGISRLRSVKDLIRPDLYGRAQGKTSRRRTP